VILVGGSGAPRCWARAGGENTSERTMATSTTPAPPLPVGERVGVRGSRTIESASAPHPTRFARRPLPARTRACPSSASFLRRSGKPDLRGERRKKSSMQLPRRHPSRTALLDLVLLEQLGELVGHRAAELLG